VPRTSTAALTAATLPYVLQLANLGTEAALAGDAALAQGLMTQEGELMTEAVPAPGK
jgi:alanine dehydrogenase